MISALKSSSVVICVCTIACSMFSLIAPMGRMKKTIDIVLSLFLISSMLIPIISYFSSFDSQININEQSFDVQSISEQEYTELVLNQTASDLVSVTDELLKSEGIEAQNIKISLKKTEKNSIYVSKVDIYINKKYEQRLDDIKHIVSINMLKEPEIYINE